MGKASTVRMNTCKGSLLGSGQGGVIKLLEVLEIVYQDVGNQIKIQLLQGALESLKDRFRGSESLQLASAYLCLSHPNLPGGLGPPPAALSWARSSPAVPGVSSFPPLMVQRETQAQAALRAHPSVPEEKGEERGGGRREEEFLRGPEPSVRLAEEERPSPRALIAVASCPSPPASV